MGRAIAFLTTGVIIALAGLALATSAFATGGGSGGSPGPTPVPPFGDANCDGSTTSIDAALVLQYSAEVLDEFLPCLYVADMNTDCYINAVDATLVLQTTAGLLAEEPFEPFPCPA